MLDIGQSAYIFRQKFLLSIIILGFAAGLVLFFFYRISKAKPEANRPCRTVYANIFFIVITVAAYLLFFFPLFRDTLRLKQRGIETEGMTVRWVDIGDGQPNIEYTFRIDGITFVKQAEVVYGGKQIEGIVCPGGKNVVIYDKSNHENAEIDLKRPILQHSGQQ
jgi:hypothetical protein